MHRLKDKCSKTGSYVNSLPYSGYFSRGGGGKVHGFCG